LFIKNNIEWNENRLGIITPFRAQIAKLTNTLRMEGFSDIPLTIDTAERYQGSTRDIIIISTVISHERQLAQISSLNQDGIDRKLNVALTRAKEQIIMVGNATALQSSPVYKELINHYWLWDFPTSE
jgi:DNA replication ATP-dependent helicase Dna2